MSSNSAAAVRTHYQQAVEGFLDLLPALGEDDWRKPALGVWTVRDLVGHTSRALLTVESYLDSTRTTTDPSMKSALDYFRAGAVALADPGAVAERGRQAGAALGGHPATEVATIARRVLDLVERSEDDALVSTPAGGTMTLAGYLPTRTFELVVHSLDLASATGAGAPSQLTEPLTACLELAAQLAAERGGARDVLLALTGRQALPAGFSVV